MKRRDTERMEKISEILWDERRRERTGNANPEGSGDDVAGDVVVHVGSRGGDIFVAS